MKAILLNILLMAASSISMAKGKCSLNTLNYGLNKNVNLASVQAFKDMMLAAVAPINFPDGYSVVYFVESDTVDKCINLGLVTLKNTQLPEVEYNILAGLVDSWRPITRGIVAIFIDDNGQVIESNLFKN